MAKKLFIILVILLIFCGSANASKVALVVQSTGAAKYYKALEGIQSILDHKIRNIILTTSDFIDINKEIKRDKPELIIAIGQDALYFVRNVKHIPVGYLLAFNPNVINGQKNFFGVTSHLNQTVRFKVVKDLLPNVTTIGFIYNPTALKTLEKDVLKETANTGYEIVFKPVESSSKVPPILFELVNKVDAVWLYPDASLMNPESVEHLFLFSLENQVPIISCESKFVFNGASISIDVDEYDSGRMIGRMAKKVLSGERLKVSKIDPERASVKLNSRLIRMIGIEIDTDDLKQYGN